MGQIEIHDGVSNRRFRVTGFEDDIEIYLDERRIVVPDHFDIEIAEKEGHLTRH